ncbi:MAG: DMT family transporter [Pseudomonadales bacterium]|nr:DMT family transporter [Pseudomonadales bacterium]
MSNRNQKLGLAFAVACVGIATYSGMDVVMKGLSLQLGAYNAMFWRSIIAVILAGLLFAWERPTWPTTTVLKLHVWRGLVISMMAFLFFWGLKFLPVAEAIGLTFIAPLIALYLAAIILKEQISKQAILASIIGLGGAIVVITGRLGGEYNEDVGRGIAAILTSAMLYAYNLILQRQQAVVAKPIEIGFFQNCTVIILFGALAPFLAVPPSLTFLPNLAGAAVLGLVSLMMMSWAYARAPASTLLPIEYTAFAWAALFGWLVFSESVTITTLIGTAMIVAGCLVAAWQKPEQVEHVETTAV